MTVPGYLFSATSCGLKAKGKLDFAMILSERPAKATACFTTNRFAAPPVEYGKKILKKSYLNAVLVNAGNANAGTGKLGYDSVIQVAKRAGLVLGVPPETVLVSSTGKIGRQLPLKKLLPSVENLKDSLSAKSSLNFAQAICTTDRWPKVHQVKVKVGGKSFHVTGIAKGAGMIEPHMATMLAYIMTDLDLNLPLMKKTFKEAVNQSFNAISVDGDQSTNDTALLMANGSSGLSLSSTQSPGFAKFREALHEVCHHLALSMIADGEGATKVVEIQVQGAKTEAQARKLAYTVARSQLVKTSFFGQDPNWGRVLAALGYAGVNFNPQKVDIYYGKIPLVQGGLPLGDKHEKQAHRLMKQGTFSVKVELHQGKGAFRLWTSDLGYEYIRINAEYST
ncbi:MAG: bifunctional glutamate N-acetyltransferase/amino-acid acetyltransferase ArgJ [Deltaproteobacteria bacterium]|nr:bifunctional glutamate N-acetyltransferase/amino-acid acetyltransferase ArgJ [Deltaproteobacteria bacterium]